MWDGRYRVVVILVRNRNLLWNRYVEMWGKSGELRFRPSYFLENSPPPPTSNSLASAIPPAKRNGRADTASETAPNLKMFFMRDTPSSEFVHNTRAIITILCTYECTTSLLDGPYSPNFLAACKNLLPAKLKRRLFVEHRGIEPLTSALQRRRSTN